MLKKFTAGALLLALLTLAAEAHFVFIVPSASMGGRAVQVVFSDNLEPDREELLKKIAHTKYFTVGPKGDLQPIKVKRAEKAACFEAEVPGKGPAYIIGQCPYGVIEKGGSPFRLNYTATALVGSDGKTTPTEPAKVEGLLVLVNKSGDKVDVRWNDKPLADAEVVLKVPGSEENITTKSDKAGQVAVPKAKKGGLYAVRAKHVEEGKGKQGDKEYNSTRHYATLVFASQQAGTSSGAKSALPAAATVAVIEKPVAKENPEASKLLADARAARANWNNFPGFTADVKFNVEGKVVTGKLEVSSKGKATLEMADNPERDWARRTLSSVVGHRLDNSTDLNTPCAFLDEVTEHPLGRSIQVLNDEFHSSYRIRDRQVIEVNRRMGEVRFTITVLENRLNAEKKFLPVSYMVNTWVVKSGTLRSSVTHHQTWKRIGEFDLPETVTVVSAESGKQTTRTLTLSGWKLLGK